MPRVHLEAPGSKVEDVLELGERSSVVLGRNPDLRRLAPELDLGAATEHPIALPSVSANHLAVRTRDGELSLRDLGSRNGTWLRLPSDVTVTIPSSDNDVHVRLGFPPSVSGRDRTIDPPTYDDPSEYAPAVAREIERWLVETGIALQITIAADRTAKATGVVELPLATGDTLHVLASRTVDEHYADLLVTIGRYVAAQNALFSAEQEARSDGMILASAAIQQVHRRVVECAMRNVTRLVLLGPSGTGKERLASAYHRHLDRTGPLITVNCATLTRDRIVADLFGAEAGAYTGAQRPIVGAVERADGGTLFLDEIGEMPVDVQAQLLRFLDTGEYQRLGATGVDRHADVRVVAATNRDLRAMVNDGTFRLDLFFRIALEVIEVPSLRERFKDAIAYLAGQSLGKVSALDALQPASLDVLRAHPWGGNFRELVNFVLRMPRDASAQSVTAEDIQGLLRPGSTVLRPPPATTPVSPGDWSEWLRDSAAAYCTDSGTTGPTTWSEMTAFIEQYLKPNALVHMAGVAGATNIDDVSIPKVADALKADRGTVVKQLRRYFDGRR